MNLAEMSDRAVLEELGLRLRHARLNRNLTQAKLAEQAGIALRTLQKAEAGKVTTLETLVALLRGLGLLAELDAFLPEPPQSPVQLAKLQGRTRQRASGQRAPGQRGSSAGAPRWQWKE
jgi:putative transcriptional regulator